MKKEQSLQRAFGDAQLQGGLNAAASGGLLPINNPPISSSLTVLLTNKSRVILLLKRPREKKSSQALPNNELSPDKGLPLNAGTTKLCCHPVIFLTDS